MTLRGFACLTDDFFRSPKIPSSHGRIGMAISPISAAFQQTVEELQFLSLWLEGRAHRNESGHYSDLAESPPIIVACRSTNLAHLDRRRGFPGDSQGLRASSGGRCRQELRYRGGSPLEGLEAAKKVSQPRWNHGSRRRTTEELRLRTAKPQKHSTAVGQPSFREPIPGSVSSACPIDFATSAALEAKCRREQKRAAPLNR